MQAKWIVTLVLCVITALVKGQTPTISTHPLIYTYGEDVSLECGVFGGSHTFTWEVPAGSTSLSRGTIVNGSSSLTLTFTAFEDDSGTYSCQIVGSSGSPATTTVTVVPAIVSGPMDMTIEYSDDLTATFTCTAFGGNDTVLVFTWSQAGSPAGLNMTSERETLNPDNSTTSTITTNTLSLADRGSQYVCDVEYDGSSEGNDAEATLNIVPAIVEDPQSILVGVGLGRNASFTCTAYGGPLASSPSLVFTWRGPVGVDISNVETLAPVNDRVTSVLTLVNVTVDYEGNYSCSVAYNDMTEIVSNSELATLGGITDPPDITEPPADTTEGRGNTTIFSCSAVGNGTLNVTWRLPTGEMVYTGQDMVNVWSVNSSLTVVDITADDGGNYTCIVGNEAGETEATAVLTVRLYMSEEQVGLNTTNGTFENITCVIEGFPISYVWKKMDDIILGSGSGMMMPEDNYSSVSTGRVLEFNPVVFGDEGVYRCVASSDVGDDLVSDAVTVTISPEDGVSVTPVGVVYEEGDNVTFSCSAEGGPDNSLQWLKDDVNITSVIDGSENNLTLTSITVSGDGGVYTCVASNAAGTDRASVSLNISPVIVMHPVNIVTTNGTSEAFMCSATAFPNPTYMWNRVGDNLPATAVGADNSTLTLSPAVFGDHGEYYCNATSSGVTVSSGTATLTISPEGGVMIYPENETFDDLTNVTLICVTFGGPGNTFQWSFNGDDIEDETSSELTLMSVTAEDGGTYTCNVTNSAGSDTYSTSVFISPRITLDPTSVNASNGTTEISFTCNATGFPQPEIEWMREDDSLPTSASGENTTTLTIAGENTTTLTIAPVLFGDEGLYYCVATSNQLTVESTRATLSISPVGSISPGNTIAMVGEAFMFMCSVLGGPSNTFRWELNSVPLPNEMMDTLLLTSVTVSDAGIYSCVVTNDAGEDTTESELFVSPNIITSPQDVEVDMGDSVTFTCVAEGAPVPDITWEYVGDGEESSNSSASSSGQSSGSGSFLGDISVSMNETTWTSTLTIDPVQYDSYGLYRCVANSSALMMDLVDESDIAFLTVSPSVGVTPPQIDAQRNTAQTFVCSAEGGPRNMLSWTRPSDGAVISNSSELEIEVANASVGGTYQCTVENRAGSDSGTVLLNVVQVISQPPADANITRTEELVLVCTADGFPLPSIVWTHNGTEVDADASDDTTITEVISTVQRTSALTVTSTSFNDSGEYVCVAISAAFPNISSDPALVLIQDRPEQPQNLTALNITSRSITLEWIEPHHNNAPVTGYNVTFSRPDFLSGATEIVSSTEETVVITGLHPGVEYVFTVEAFNAIGESVPSDEERATTLEEVPSDSPQNVTVMTLSSREIEVSWEEVPPDSQNGEITMYEVQYEPLDTFGGQISTLTVTVNITDTSTVLTGLEEYVEYNISVRAYTSAGPGPYSDPVSQRTQEDKPVSPPGEVTVDSLSSTSIRVNWTKVPAIDQNGVITQYEVEYNQTTFPEVTMHNTTVVNSTMFKTVLSGLLEYVEYCIRVRAYTSQGPGPYTNAICVTTDEDVPASPPMTVFAENITSTSIRVSWEEVPAIDQNGVITQYEVEYNQSTFDSVPTTQNIIVNSTMTVLTGLEEYVEYSIRVRAYTSVGPGPYSDVVTVTTNEDVPASPPVTVSAENISSTSIRVSWGEVPAIDQNGVITQYEVEYNQSTFDSVPATQNVIVNSTMAVLTGLEEHVEYSIQVRAYTSQGPGPYSNAIYVTTDEDVPASPPVNVTVVNITSTSIMLIWEEVPAIDQNGVITQYEVEYNQSTFDSVPATQNKIVNSTMTVLTGLEEYVDYSIKVRAYTSVGSGPYSDVVTERTQEDFPASPPSSVSAAALSSTSIQVNWTEVPAIDRNGVIAQYEVEYNQMTFTEVTMYNTAIVASTMFTTVVTGLEEYVEYSIRVRVYTSVGPGPYSDVVTVTTNEDVPASPPVNMMAVNITFTSIHVRWGKVPAIDQNGVITQYEVEYNQSTFDSVPTTQNIIVNSTMAVLTGLEEYVEYCIRVRAYTSQGPGPYSDAIYVTTDEDVPVSPPVNVTAVNITSTSIMLIWEEVPAIDQNGVITQYEVEYNQSTFDSVPATQNKIVNSTMTVLTGLEEYVEYSIQVRAYTNVGPGPYSDAMNMTTNQDFPSSFPMNMSATTLSASEIRVNWTTFPEIDHNGIITNYEVQFNQSVAVVAYPPSDSVFVPPNTASVVLTDLGALLNYSITVRANTIIGPGPYNPNHVIAETEPSEPDPPPPPPPVNEEEDIVRDLPLEESVVTVTLRWDPPEAPGGKLEQYIVTLLALGEDVNSTDSRRKRQTDGFLRNCIMGGVSNNFTVSPNTTELDVNATSFTIYEFQVQAANSLGVGAPSPPRQFSTPESVPTMPEGLLVQYNGSMSLVVTWDPPLCDYGIRTNYTFSYVEVGNESNSDITILEVDISTMTLTDLIPNTQYTVMICAATSVGCGPFSVVTNSTDEDSPQAVTDLVINAATEMSETTVMFSTDWVRPSDRNGSFGYLLQFEADQLEPYPQARQSGVNLMNLALDDGELETFTFEGALPFANYTITLTAVNAKLNKPGPSVTVEGRTMAIAPTAITELRVEPVSSTQLSVSWELPDNPNGPLSHYLVFHREQNSTQTPSPDTDGYTESRVNYPQTNLIINGLDPFTWYSVIVQAVGEGDLERRLTAESVLVNRTHADVDTPPPTDPAVPTNVGENTYFLPLPNPLEIDTGNIIFYAIIVIRITDSFNRENPPNQSNYEDAEPYDSTADPAQEYYITAAWSNPEEVPRSYTVGDGSKTEVDSVTYENVGLSSDTDYAYLIRFDIMSDTEEMLIFYTEFEFFKTDAEPVGDNSVAIGVSVTFVILFLVAVAVLFILVCIWWRRRAYKELFDGEIAEAVRDQQQQQVMSLQPILANPNTVSPYSGTMEPIALDSFKDHVQRMHSNDDYLFSEEYNSIEPSHAPTSIASHLSCNIAKNRYANIVAYDHSRVKLNEDPSKEGSDYVNASHIDGYNQRNGFIAAQGPNPDTVADFWRMVWEQGSATIVMLTNLEEKGRVKCHQYWPDEKSGLYGRIRVHLQETLVLADYTQRLFSLQMNTSKEERIVTQYHYTVWPDHGVPEYPTSLLHFVRKVMVLTPENSGPMVVHCSAGVGRTGTFITLFAQLKRMEKEKNLDIFGFVRAMRYRRNCMVQTEPQYVFIHDAMLEAVECGITEVQARELQDQYRQLSEIDVVTKVTGLSMQFDKLDITIHHKLRRNTGNMHVNKPKNRFGANPDAIPYDRNRCRLSTIPGVEGSDYINGSFVDGYHRPRAFIATQGPLPDTQDDFWRLVWEQKSASIIMLTKEKEAGKVKCHRYWPLSGAEQYGQLQVILHNTTDYPDYILREFKLVDTKDGSSLNVKQFQYTDWPDDSVPSSGSGLIDLIGQVQKWQRSSGDRPVIAHCSGGCGRTGTYIAVSILIERLKTEGVVDVFHTVRNLRLQRPGMVQTESQYEFCFKTTLEYLESFELYDNFK